MVYTTDLNQCRHLTDARSTLGGGPHFMSRYSGDLQHSGGQGDDHDCIF
jgi:hypothetical protein